MGTVSGPSPSLLHPLHPSLTPHRADNHFVWVKSHVLGRFYTVICYLGTHCAQISGVPIKEPLCFIDLAAAFDFQLVGGWATTDPTCPHHPALRSPAQAKN